MGRYNVSNMQKTINIRLVVLGDRCVGKSALVVRYLTKRFIGEYASGSDFIYQKEINLAGSKVLAEICDAFVKKDSASYLQKLCGNAEACLLVYNVCDRSSFEYICNLAREIKASRMKCPTGGDVPMLIVGNKSDLGHFRKVTPSEGEELSKSISQCHFIETSAAESFVEVERAFQLVFRMIRSNVNSSLPPLNAGPTSGKRKKSLSQVAHLLRDHYRKQHSNTNQWNQNQQFYGKTPEKEIISNFNEVFFYDKNNNSAKNAPVHRRIRKNSTLGFNHAPAPLASKMRSKCLSLTTLNEDIANEDSSSNFFQNRKEKLFRTAREDSWKSEEIKMSTSSDDTVELSDVSAPEEDAFFSDHIHHASSTFVSENQLTFHIDEISKQNETLQSSRNISLNKKNLKICIHSDNDCVDNKSPNQTLVPPKSAPASRSGNNRFRFFPGVNEYNSFNNTYSSVFSSSSSLCSSQDAFQPQSLDFPKEDKKSPTHSFLKHFFKGHLQNSFGVRPFGNNQVAFQRSKTESSLMNFGDPIKRHISEFAKRKSSENCIKHSLKLKPRRSSASVSSSASNEENDRDPSDSSQSPPMFPESNKNVTTKTRRSSIKETVGGLIRKRKPSVANETVTHMKERYH